MASTSFVSSSTRRLEGKVALITGGASGIGEATVKLFIEHGAKVMIADIQDELGQAVREETGPNNCSYMHCNITNEDHVREAVDKTVETYGKLDIMFNNAGILGPRTTRIIDIEKQDFESILNVNIMGVFLGMKHAARVMVPNRSGTIISTASLSTIIGGAGMHAYTCSKHAVLGLTKNLAVELGQFGIRVNCVSPSGVATGMTMGCGVYSAEVVESGMNKISNLKGATLRARDVANAVLYLASNESSFVSGLNLMVDGGFSIVNQSINLFKDVSYD